MYEIIESTFLYGGGEIRNAGFVFLIWELAYKEAPVYHPEPVGEVHPQLRGGLEPGWVRFGVLLVPVCGNFICLLHGYSFRLALGVQISIYENI